MLDVSLIIHDEMGGSATTDRHNFIATVTRVPPGIAQNR